MERSFEFCRDDWLELWIEFQPFLYKQNRGYGTQALKLRAVFFLCLKVQRLICENEDRTQQENKMEHRIRAAIDIWVARIGTAFGWVWFVLYALAAVVAFCELPDAKDSLDRVMPFVCLGLAAVHFLIIRVSKRTRELVSDFRYYAQLLAKNKSIDALSRTVKEPKEEVERKLLLMCKRGYFQGRIDLQDDCLVLEDAGSAARCPGCGATTRIYRNGDKCRYCGNPLMMDSSK